MIEYFSKTSFHFSLYQRPFIVVETDLIYFFQFFDNSTRNIKIETFVSKIMFVGVNGDQLSKNYHEIIRKNLDFYNLGLDILPSDLR